VQSFAGEAAGAAGTGWAAAGRGEAGRLGVTRALLRGALDALGIASGAVSRGLGASAG
jgi:hypothetical protein